MGDVVRVLYFYNEIDILFQEHVSRFKDGVLFYLLSLDRSSKVKA